MLWVPRGAPQHLISTFGRDCIGPALGSLSMQITTATGPYPTASMAFYYPFQVSAPMLAQVIGIMNGTPSGNADVGIYNESGTRLVSVGSTGLSGSSLIQSFDIADTLLVPGRYYMALAVDNTTATFARAAPSVSNARAMGILQQASGFVLPSTATFAVSSGTPFVPAMGVYARTVT